MRRKGLRFPNGIPRGTMSDKPADTDIAAATVALNGDLRDRIVAAIAKADQDWCSDDPLYEDMADAVIEVLNLRTDEVGTLSRYVTEWTTNE